MANPYEMVVLYHPDLEIDLDKPLKKVETIVKNHKGKIVKTDNWGKRKLAYPIKGEDNAIYVYYDVELESESLAKIENNFNITDEVLRYLIVKPGPELEDEDADEKSAETSKRTSSESEEEPKAKKPAKAPKAKEVDTKEDEE